MHFKNRTTRGTKYFLQKSLTIEQEFLEGTKRFYNAEMALTDYQKDPEGARKEVNDWVENKTKENIKNLIPTCLYVIRMYYECVITIYLCSLTVCFLM